jgi:D-beta-D-heptose 7-phosphate kinase/D-beta-D-heptose 1-phosphate adenosyltransferase
MKIGIISGGFDPLHSGHIDYIVNASTRCDFLYIGPNSDEWLIRKKGSFFMPWEERAYIIRRLKLNCDFLVTKFNDDDESAMNLIHLVDKTFSGHEICFMNGGDRTTTNIPEEKMTISDSNSLSFEFGIGGEHKKNSSSKILDDWKTQKTEKDWGFYRVLDDKKVFKTKELVIHPGKSLSDQRHLYRNEHWYVLNGELLMHTQKELGLITVVPREHIVMKPHDTLLIKAKTWHKPVNIGKKPCHVIEIQFGERCEEEDIERR